MGAGEKVFRASLDPNGIPNHKTGTSITAAMHVFCAVVGAGVLALPYSVSWLGWIAGPLLVVIFFLISLLSCHMLASIYEVNGIEHQRYHHAVAHILSRREAIAVSVFQLINIFLTTLAYTITGAKSLQEIIQLSCKSAGDPVDPVTGQVESSGCFSSDNGGVWQLALVFGAVELVLSQVRNLEEAWWVSSIGTVGSLTYASIALIISFVHSGNRQGTIGGRPGTSTADKLFGIFNSLGSIGFAYNFMLILLEIQDTIHQPPSAVGQMKKAVNWAVTGSFVFYILVSIAGYLAMGNAVTDNILLSYSGPAWALIIADVAVLAHMFTAYQVFGQALFNTVESWVKWWQLQKEIKKEAKAAAAAAAAHKGDGDPSTGGVPSDGNTMPTPFDAAHTPDIEHKGGQAHPHKPLLGLDHVKLTPIDERLSSQISGALTQARLSSVMTQTNHKGSDDAPRRKASMRTSMYTADTGFANEEVPLNEEGYLVPFHIRLIVRSAYVLLITLLACIMPFFGAFAGLVGALTFFPLAIYFPYALYRKVYTVSPAFSKFLWAIWYVMLVVALLATVGATRNVIVGWSQFKIFGG